MIFLLHLWVIAIGLRVICVLCQWLVIWTFRLPVTGIKIFNGPTISRMDLLGGQLTIGCIPLDVGLEVDADRNRELSWSKRICILMGPPAAMLAFAWIAVGWEETRHHFIDGFWEIPLGAWEPLARGQRMISEWRGALSGGWGCSAGILATKQAAFCLLPFGGSVITHALAFAGSRWKHQAWEKMATASGMLYLLILAIWIFSCSYHGLLC